MKFYWKIYEKNIFLCLWINKRIKNNAGKKLAFLAFSPYLIAKWAVDTLLENTICKKKVIQQIEAEKNKCFEGELAIVAIAKNEARFIREWIAYHLSIGVDKVILYDNDSSDDLYAAVKPFVEQDKVMYISFPGECQQLPAYNHAIDNFKDKFRYMAFIDCDEFILNHSNLSLVEVIHNLVGQVPNAAGIGVNWAVFGSSGYEKSQELVTQVFLKRGEQQAWHNRHVKCIVNPRLVVDYVSPHFPALKCGAWNITNSLKRQRLWFIRDVDFSVLQINHYFCKSREDFIRKRSRGLADRNGQYDFSKFDLYDLNEVYDDEMLKYGNDIRRIMGEANG